MLDGDIGCHYCLTRKAAVMARRRADKVSTCREHVVVLEGIIIALASALVILL